MKHLHNYILFLAFLLFFFNCKEEQDEYIILTKGLGMNPDEPRVGIELTRHKLYFCKEVFKQKKIEDYTFLARTGEYTYFTDKFDSNQFDTLKDEIKHYFKRPISERQDIVDVSYYELIYKFTDKIDVLRFCLNELNDEQAKLIDKILSQKGSHLKEIPYHPFPESYLKETLPLPPPLELK